MIGMLLGSLLGKGRDAIKDKKDDIMADAKSKAKSVMKSKDKDGNLVYPDAKEDLLTHYFASQTMSGKWGVAMPISLALGLIKEIGDLSGLTGSNTGFSWDDIGADIAGMRYTPEEANERGLFTHTEGSDNWTGQGQGLFTEVLRKLFG